MVALGAVGHPGPAHAIDGTNAASIAVDPLALERAISDHVDLFQPRVEEGRLRLESRRGALGAELASHGASLTVAGHELHLALCSIGRAGHPRPVPTAPPRIAGAEVRLPHGRGISEWWRALPSGLEQGFTLAAALPGAGDLELSLRVDGDLVPRMDDDAIELVDDGVVVGRYGHLVALDADGRGLEARMTVRDGQIVLAVDDRDARYPITVDPLVTLEEGLLVPSGLAASDNLGVAVAISDDGSRAIVGAPEDAVGANLNVGAAYVFVRSGISWTLEATLRAGGGGGMYEFFGSAVAISGDGALAVATAPEYPEVACDCSVGGVWAYVRSGSTWGAPTRLVPTGGVEQSDRLGTSVAVTRDGSRVVVGAAQFNGARGQAFVFRRGPTWTEEARITGTTSSDLLGSAVAISADGTRALVGVPGWDTPVSNAGGARVWVRSGTTWSVETTIVPSIVSAAAEAGYAVALSEDASRALVGVWHADVGASNAGGASVFLRSGTTWAEEATLLSTTPRAGASLGTSVGITADGRRALLGARSGALGGVASGTASVFVRDAATWSEATVFAFTGAAAGDAFGCAVAISADGRRGIVGARDDDAPAADSGSARAFLLGANDGQACTADVDCGSGHCVDGVCCDTACGGGAPDCEACSAALNGMRDGVCSPAISGTECRPSAGRCDPAETCNGSSRACPVDALAGVSEVCRPSMHPVCDPEERCDGASVDCPMDGWASVDTACGTVPSGACDLPDHCQGDGPRCVELYVERGVACNSEPVTGACDTADVCTGDRPDCPPTFLSGFECRASTGGCDPPEVCSGTAADCPPDEVSPTGTVCRASSDLSCDPLESCDGVTAACPANTNTCPDFDAGPNDGGPTPTPVAGCGCSSAGPHGAGPLAVLFAIAAWMGARRRRAAARRSG